MIYNSFNFIILFPLIFLLYYLIPVRYQRGRNLFLLAVSYLLYMNWKPVYALILLGVTGVTYMTSILIEKYRQRAKPIMMIGIILALIPLLFFKYFNFINGVVYDILSALGIRFQMIGLNWAVPVGISFFTFQALSYVWDVYYEKIKSERDFLVYALYVSFFPSIMAGPINRASLVIPQIKNLRPYFDYTKAVEGLRLLLWGMFMKVVVADRLGLYVDVVLPNYSHYTGMTCLLASFFYTIQIYADFGGYSLMAVGVGNVLGFELTENFRNPYFSYSVTDFWRRWHISLSNWLKDYVYIPLGGSRCSKVRNYWNIFVTFLVSGIWHGANWTFIVWGCLHGLMQIIEKMFGLQKCGDGRLTRGVRIVLTFIFVNFAWIFFRMPTLSEGFNVICRIFDWTLPLTVSVEKATIWDIRLWLLGISMLFIKDLFDEFLPGRLNLYHNRNVFIRWCCYIYTFVLIMLAGVLGADQFIYAEF